MYKLTRDPNQIIRLSDGAMIPNAPNGDWQLYQDWLANGGVPLPADPLPPTPPNWDKLLEAIFNPDELYPIYTRLTEASFVNPISVTLESMAMANNIAVAAGKIDQAIQVTRVEEAVASALQLLTQTSSYVFTKEEKLKWNSTVESLNFSPLMFLP